MTIRTILVPVRGDGKGEGVLDHALALAAPFNAHIAVVHCRPRPQDMIPFGVAVPQAWREQITAAAGNIANTEEEKVRERFDDYVAARSLTLSEERPAPDDRVTVSFTEATGKQAAIVARRGRLADIVAVAKPDRDSNLGYGTLEAALLETGRPVLLCPPGPAADVGRHVAVAWNGATEVSRAVALAMPVIARADRVSVMSEPEAAAVAGGAEDFRLYLGDHGVHTEAAAIASDGGGIGARLLKTAKALGADMILMGAYGRSRGRELIMGGATQSIIDKTDLPVLLGH